MYIKAYGKINISLDVVGKREDGYHLLKMIMQSIELYDLIKMDECSSDISVLCDKSYIPTDGRNIAYKAAEMFFENYNIDKGIRISIQKNIPVAAGLAGGSSDAAAVLKGLSKMFRPQTTIDELKAIGVKLGADVPYCITGGTALCEGIGEICTPLRPFKDKILVLIKPNFGVSTAEVYGGLDLSKINRHPDTERLINAIKYDNVQLVGRYMGNVLENVTIKNHPILKNIKNELVNSGAYGTLMSGSGPTVFGFFKDMLLAQRCYDEIKEKYQEVFITRTI